MTGLPRTGTTALHRLLADDPVFQQIQAGYEQHKVAHPEFLGAHEMSAEQVEECRQLLRQSAMSISYECLANIPTYSAWLEGQDWTAAYARHRRNLQLIGLPGAGRPAHRYTLEEFGLRPAEVDDRFSGYLAAQPDDNPGELFEW